MIATLAVATGLAPSVLWAQDAVDLATLVDVIEQAAARRG